MLLLEALNVLVLGHDGGALMLSLVAPTMCGEAGNRNSSRTAKISLARAQR